MNIALYIKAKKVRFWAEAGWYSGEPFAVFDTQIIEEYNDGKNWTIIHIKVAKLMIGFGFELLD